MSASGTEGLLGENRPQPPLSPLAIFWYCLANFGIGAFYVLNNAVLPLWLGRFTQNACLISMMAGSHSFEGTIIQPVVGSLSDRLQTRLGRRRPFMLLFFPIAALFMALTPFAGHLGPGIRLAAIVICIVLFTMTFNIALDPYQSMMVDISPADQRGRISGVWFFFGALGQVAVVFLPISSPAKFGAAAAILLITVLLTCAKTREPSSIKQEKPTQRKRDEIKAALHGLRILRQARLYLVMYFCYGAGVEVVVPNLTRFIKSATHCSDGESEKMFLILMAVTAVGSLFGGWISDKIGAKKLLIVGIVLIGAAAVNGLWVHTLLQVAIVLIVAGLGTAAQNGSAYPLLTKLVPCEEIGFYTGLQTTALSIAGPLSLFLTGILINHQGYRVIFGVCTFCVLIATVVLLRLHVHLAPAEIETRDREQGRIAAAELVAAR